MATAALSVLTSATGPAPPPDIPPPAALVLTAATRPGVT